jgi:hypothetical protein
MLGLVILNVVLMSFVILFVDQLIVIMLSIVQLNIIMLGTVELNVIMLSIVMLNVMSFLVLCAVMMKTFKLIKTFANYCYGEGHDVEYYCADRQRLKVFIMCVPLQCAVILKIFILDAIMHSIDKLHVIMLSIFIMNGI